MMAHETPRDAPVLVVHCHESFCRFISEVLELEGYEVLIAPFGRSALRRLRSSPRKMIVLLEPIVLMVEGNDALHAFITDPRQRTGHCVIVMAPTDAFERVRDPLRPDGHLVMPFGIEQLLAAVAEGQRFIQSAQWRRPTQIM